MQTTDSNFSNAEKIQRVISNILDKEAIFQQGHWSSAANFERWLAEDGFVPPCQISYQYKFPDGISEADYEKKIMNNMYYLAFFKPFRIENPKQYVDYVFQTDPDATDTEKQQYLDFLNSVTGELNDEEKQKIIAHFTSLKNQNAAWLNINNMVHEIKLLNPVLLDVPVNNLEDAQDLLIGVTSRFHPEDIKYFMTEKKKSGGMDKIRQDQKLFYTVLNYSPHLFIAPSRIKQIVNGIILQKQKLSTRE
ncbi:MAG: hypothetical protein R8N50_00265 [Alphaproteobacteria bacterium]|nr:hypothetical protein [Alphaproteobacteria bacterium]